MTVRLYTDDKFKTRSKMEGKNKNNSLRLITIKNRVGAGHNLKSG